jgi:hypothetical protein
MLILFVNSDFRYVVLSTVELSLVQDFHVPVQLDIIHYSVGT